MLRKRYTFEQFNALEWGIYPRDSVLFISLTIDGFAGRYSILSDSNKDNKFKEELEKELETGLFNASENHENDDFTVRVRREDYIVKRRFYDKDKALEAAETLRKDKRNLVDDTIEGKALTPDEDDDEKVDWDKLVDAGLEFDPPIAHAAEKKPGEDPVGLAEQIQKKIDDDKELEKTLVVKRPKVVPVLDDQPDEDVAFEDEEPESEPVMVSTPAHAADKRSKTVWWILAVLILAGAAAALFYGMKPSSEKPRVTSAIETKQPMPIVKMPMKSPTRSVEESPALAIPPKKTPEAQPENVQVEPKRVIEKETPPDVSTLPEKKSPVSATPVIDKAEPVLPEVTDHFTHTVHVSSYQDMKRANTAVDRLKKKGFDAFSGVVRISGKGDWYRVYVGYLTNLDDAKALAEKIKAAVHEDALARKTPWAIQVGKTAPLSQLETLVSGLKKKGYAANTVPVSKNNDVGRILTGAFKSEEEAAPMVSALTNEGFDAKVVQR